MVICFLIYIIIKSLCLLRPNQWKQYMLLRFLLWKDLVWSQLGWIQGKFLVCSVLCDLLVISCFPSHIHQEAKSFTNIHPKPSTNPKNPQSSQYLGIFDQTFPNPKSFFTECPNPRIPFSWSPPEGIWVVWSWGLMGLKVNSWVLVTCYLAGGFRAILCSAGGTMSIWCSTVDFMVDWGSTIL